MTRAWINVSLFLTFNLLSFYWCFTLHLLPTCGNPQWNVSCFISYVLDQIDHIAQQHRTDVEVLGFAIKNPGKKKRGLNEIWDLLPPPLCPSLQIWKEINHSEKSEYSIPELCVDKKHIWNQMANDKVHNVNKEND